VAKNPDFGAVITYFVKEVPKTKKEIRKEKEKDLFKKGEPIPQPSEGDLRAERNELAPYLTFIITDENGSPVRVINKSASKGISRVNWDLRYQSSRPVNADEKFDPLATNGSGVLAMPGTYKVTMWLTAGGETKQLAGPAEIKAVLLNNLTLPPADRSAMTAFHKKVSELTRVMQGTEDYADLMNVRINSILESLNNMPNASEELKKKATVIAMELDTIRNIKINRRTNKPSEEENPPAPVPLNSRLGKLTWITWSSTQKPTEGQLDAYAILESEFPPVYNQVKQIGQVEIPALEKSIESLGGPVTPGRLPEWKK
jgi:hypothetical protein